MVGLIIMLREMSAFKVYAQSATLFRWMFQIRYKTKNILCHRPALVTFHVPRASFSSLGSDHVGSDRQGLRLRLLPNSVDVGRLIDPQLCACILGFTPVNERVTSVRLRVGGWVLTVVSYQTVI